MPDEDDVFDSEDAPPFWKVPDHLRKVVEATGFIQFGETVQNDEDEEAIYARMRAGKCMTCAQDLGENTNFIINRHGVVGAYCSGVCHSDMAILGYLGEQHTEIMEQVKFRMTGTADSAPGDDDADTEE